VIGIAADPADLAVACEFFELFKTPWEPAVAGKRYAAVLCTNGAFEALDAPVMFVYGSERHRCDHDASVVLLRERAGAIDWDGRHLPVYGQLATFDGGNHGAHDAVVPRRAFRYERRCGTRVTWRIGYDLFREIHHLLTEGQPVAHASTPTLELHIALLRQLLLDSGVPFIEVPPRPAGYDFTCCLTHDLDFFGIRRHRFDRTLAGFIARASGGSLIDWLSGRRPFAEALRNCRALASLPFVFLGMQRDFWHPVDDYEAADAERRSTYFVIPFKNRPGIASDGPVTPRRAVKYQASEVADDLRRAAAGGSEVALHGIDAWRDTTLGGDEMRQMTQLTNQPTVGVRMHWLWWSTDSPVKLERAGFSYDSTWGYNEAIGYRAGTSQVFRLVGTRQLMELPLTIMDTALFYPDRMGLRRDEALQRCRDIVTDMHRFGGTLVINWHDRSLAPERLWGETYQELLRHLSARYQVWFATATEAVDWFRWRRSIAFTRDESGRINVTADHAPESGLPGAAIHVHGGRGQRAVGEMRFTPGNALTVAL
jgi:hypothetical protein